MKKRGLVIGGIVIAAGVLGAAGWYFFLRDESSAAAAGGTVYVSEISTLTQNAAGITNRYAGVVEPQETVEIKIDTGRKVNEVQVKAGEEVKVGQLLFEYDLSSIQEDLQEAQLALDRLKNDALSLKEQIATLEAEKREASADNQLSYTIEIETNKMNLRKNEYDQKSKEAEIAKLHSATGSTEVRSEIDGVVQKIDTSKLNTEDGDVTDVDLGYDDYSQSSGSESNAFITILSTGAYRIKGKVNEQNAGFVIPGSPVIIRSRVDDEQTWRGTMGAVDRESAETGSNNNNMYFGMMDAGGDSQTTSSSYPFYVELDSSEGLMLGQHVYIEMDEGQEDQKQGVWLSDFFIVDADSENPYVWAADEKDRLEKRPVILGQYDEGLAEYEIADGLEEDDCIAFPTDSLEEGMPVTVGTGQQTLAPMTDIGDDMDNMDGMDMEGIDMGGMDMEGVDMSGMDMEGVDMGGMDMEDVDMGDMDMNEIDMGDADMEGAADMGGEVIDDMEAMEEFPDDDLVPMEEMPGDDMSEGVLIE